MIEEGMIFSDYDEFGEERYYCVTEVYDGLEERTFGAVKQANKAAKKLWEQKEALKYLKSGKINPEYLSVGSGKGEKIGDQILGQTRFITRDRDAFNTLNDTINLKGRILSSYKSKAGNVLRRGESTGDHWLNGKRTKAISANKLSGKKGLEAAKNRADVLDILKTDVEHMNDLKRIGLGYEKTLGPSPFKR
jgi:hypothetical protein